MRGRGWIRISEAVALQWQDIDFEAKQLRLRRRYRVKELGDPKNAASARTVPMASTLVTRLRQWSAQAPKKAPEALAFGTSTGGFESDANVLTGV